MTEKGEVIEFEISESCSAGLMESIRARKLQGQDRFTLMIKKGPIVVLLEKMIPEFVCLFHIGCSADGRPPSFEYTEKYGDTKGKKMVFSYRRNLSMGLFVRNEHFRDTKGTRDLEALALALSDPGNYDEHIIFSYSGPDGKMGRSVYFELIIKNHCLHTIRGFKDAPKDFCRKNIRGFEGSILDANRGPLAKSASMVGVKKWEALFLEKGFGLGTVIEDIYDLFQTAAPSIGKKMPTRKPLSVYER